MTFNDIARDHSLIHTPQGKQIILDTIAQYPYMTIAHIMAVWAGIQSIQGLQTLRYTVPSAALCYPPTAVQPAQNNKVETENEVDLAAPFMNENQGAVSETLAKILVAQAKYNEAIEVYDKLCLKNPQKSVYFAERIAHIKAKINAEDMSKTAETPENTSTQASDNTNYEQKKIEN